MNSKSFLDTLKSFFTRNWQHFAVILLFIIIAFSFYKPEMNGMRMSSHDMLQWKGMSNEIEMFRGETGEQTLWTNSMFGGMPSDHIGTSYPSNLMGKIKNWYIKSFPRSTGLLLLHMLGFYILALFLRIKPIVGFLGAMAFSFASYEIIIVQAGHLTKSFGTAFMAPTLGALIYAYRDHRIWGILLGSVFFTFQVMANHPQVTYYFGFVLIAVGIFFMYRAFKDKQIKPFVITSAGLVLGFIVSVFINIGSLKGSAEYAKYTIRGDQDLTIKADGTSIDKKNSGLDKDYITNWSNGVGETFTLISPNVKGGGTYEIAGSQFEEIADELDLSPSDIDGIKRMSSYWGDQPFVAGPVYIGVIVALLAILGMFFIQSGIKWPIFITGVIAMILALGKNFMPLTDFLIDYFPMYNKFRTITIALVITELCFAVLAMLAVKEMIERRSELLEEKKKLFSVAGGFFLIVLILKFTGLGDNFSSSMDQENLDKIETNIREQISKEDPVQLKAQMGLDVNNEIQMQEFISSQMEPYTQMFVNVKEYRKAVYDSSINRSLIFLFFGIGALALFFFSSLSPVVLPLTFSALIMIDLMPIAHYYVGDEEKYWIEEGEFEYPFAVNNADEQIMAAELLDNNSLNKGIDEWKGKGEEEADKLGLEDNARKNLINSYRFYGLNKQTHYRVMDLLGGFNSSAESFYHKTISGYHAAKLRNIQNVIEFHLSGMNQDVYDMLNTKYFISQDKASSKRIAIPRETALGNAWLVQDVVVKENADEEILALGNQFEIENGGKGTLLINGNPTKKSQIYGREKIKYVFTPGDTVEVNIQGGMRKGETAVFVRDKKGKTANVIPQALEVDTLNSFDVAASYTVVESFEPKTEVIVQKKFAEKLSAKKYSGSGTVKLDSYTPNKLNYSAELDGKQLIVFSEIYYPAGWKAFVDGKETDILKVNYLLRGLEVDGGKHKIEFVYDVPFYHTANKITFILSLLLILSVLGYGVYDLRSRSKKEVA